MPYCTLSDLQKKISNDLIIEMTDDVSAGTVDQTVIDAVILEADEQIDSFVGKVKTVPLSPVPGIIKNLSVTISIWKLFVRRGSPDEVREGEYKDALMTLKNIADRKQTLGDDEASLANENTEGGPVSSKTECDRTFTKTTLEGF